MRGQHGKYHCSSEGTGNMCAKVYNNEPLTVDEHKIVNYVTDALA